MRPGRGDAGIVSKEGTATRSMGILRLAQESEESEDFLDRMDPERVLMERMEPELEERACTEDLDELPVAADATLEQDDIESMDLLLAEDLYWSMLSDNRSAREPADLLNLS